MTELGRFVEAIAEVESGNNPQAWGDKGRAMGRYQVHPEFVEEFATRPLRGEWDYVCYNAVSNFYERQRPLWPDVLHVAMAFHLGVHAAREGEWDSRYADRFTNAFQAIT